MPFAWIANYSLFKRESRDTSFRGERQLDRLMSRSIKTKLSRVLTWETLNRARTFTPLSKDHGYKTTGSAKTWLSVKVPDAIDIWRVFLRFCMQQDVGSKFASWPIPRWY